MKENLQVNLFGDQIGGTLDQKMLIFSTIALVFILLTNSFTNMKIVSFFAIVSTVFLFFGSFIIAQYTIR